MVTAPKEIPFGARLWIEGVGIVTVHDRGGAVAVASAIAFRIGGRDVAKRKLEEWLK